MPRPLPWFKFHVGASRHPKVASLTDAQRWTWICCLDTAAQQTPRGFLGTSIKAAAYLAIRPVSHLKALAEAGLLDVLEDGSVWIHDWRTWQRTDLHGPASDGLPVASDPAVGEPSGEPSGTPPVSHGVRRAYATGYAVDEPSGEPSGEPLVRHPVRRGYATGYAVGTPSGEPSGTPRPSTTSSSLSPLSSVVDQQVQKPGETGERGRAVEAESATANATANAMANVTAWERAALRALRGARGYEFSDGDALVAIRDAERVLAASGKDVVHLCSKLRDYCNNPPPGQRRPGSILTALTRWVDQEIGFEVAL